MLNSSIRDAFADALEYSWSSIGRADQQLPDGDWLYLLILAGRGWGKTRTLSESVRLWIKQGFNYVNLIGATADDVRTVAVEGPAGILACCPNSERPQYLKRSYELRWPNGATSLLFSAEEPDRLRGKQHQKLACDEIAAWREPDAWDQALLGLRLGRKPQAIIATTPRPTKIIKDLVADPRTHLVKGRTYDNRENLSESFIHQIIRKYEGTRLGRQELEAEILSEVQGALWTHAMIEASRLPASAATIDFERVVIGVDPAVSVGEDSDLTGIVVCALDWRGDGIVLEDASGKYLPHEWALKAIALYRKWSADRVVAEINNGGQMVETTIRAVDRNVSFKSVRASKGKLARAEPVSALYEQGRVHHVGLFPELEDEMCGYAPGFSGKSPDRMDALVWALTELIVVPQRPQFVFG